MYLTNACLFHEFPYISSVDTASSQQFDLISVLILKLCEQCCALRRFCLLPTGKQPIHTAVYHCLDSFCRFRCHIKGSVEYSLPAFHMNQFHHFFRLLRVHSSVCFQKSESNSISSMLQKQFRLLQHKLCFCFIIAEPTCPRSYHTHNLEGCLLLCPHKTDK